MTRPAPISLNYQQPPESQTQNEARSIVARDQFSLRALLCWVTLLGLGFGLVRLHPGFALLVYFGGSASVLYGSLGVMTLGDPTPVFRQPRARTLGKCAIVVFFAHLLAIGLGIAIASSAPALAFAIAILVLLLASVGLVSLFFACDLHFALLVVMGVYAPALIVLSLACMSLAEAFVHS
ncbi:MAG: hypothetical protein U0836_02535 [Pirellulales bacterium]